MPSLGLGVAGPNYQSKKRRSRATAGTGSNPIPERTQQAVFRAPQAPERTTVFRSSRARRPDAFALDFLSTLHRDRETARPRKTAEKVGRPCMIFEARIRAGSIDAKQEIFPQ